METNPRQRTENGYELLEKNEQITGSGLQECQENETKNTDSKNGFANILKKQIAYGIAYCLCYSLVG